MWLALFYCTVWRSIVWVRFQRVKSRFWALQVSRLQWLPRKNMHTHWLEDSKTASRHSVQEYKQKLENIRPKIFMLMITGFNKAVAHAQYLIWVGLVTVLCGNGRKGSEHEPASVCDASWREAGQYRSPVDEASGQTLWYAALSARRARGYEAGQTETHQQGEINDIDLVNITTFLCGHN